jgi:DNA polymerase theta
MIVLKPLILEAIDSLKSMGLITEDRAHGMFEATKTGNATVASGLGPDEGVFLHDELSRALMNFNLESDMHIVYQFTPIHSSTTQGVEVDWKLLRDELDKLDESGLRAATFVGVNPAFVNRMLVPPITIGYDAKKKTPGHKVGLSKRIPPQTSRRQGYTDVFTSPLC